MLLLASAMSFEVIFGFQTQQAFPDEGVFLIAGDDDTLFFVDAAMDLVKDLDPEMPYFLSGKV